MPSRPPEFSETAEVLNLLTQALRLPKRHKKPDLHFMPLHRASSLHACVFDLPSAPSSLRLLLFTFKLGKVSGRKKLPLLSAPSGGASLHPGGRDAG